MEIVASDVEAFTEVIVEYMVTYGLSILGALIILVVGWTIAGMVKKGIHKALERTGKVDATLTPIFSSIGRYAVLIVTLIAVLNQFGVQTASLIAVLGAAGLAIGLALQGTLQNIASGVMLLWLRPLGIGDFVDAEGVSGTVMEIGLFTTEMKAADGVYIMVPNSRLWNREIKNYSRNTTRRADLTVGVGYDDDVDKAMEVLLGLLNDDPRVLDAPAPQVMVNALGDNSVNINMRCWLNAGDYWGFWWDLHKKSKLALDAAGINIPYPQRDIHIKSGSDKAA